MRPPARSHGTLNAFEPGFSLIEMLVFVAIAAMVAAVAVPLMRGPPSRLRVEAAARRIQDMVQDARAQAIIANGDRLVTLDTASGLIAGTGPEASQLPKGTVATLVVADSERLSPSKGAFRFFPDGSSTGGGVTLSLERTRVAVDVDWMTGRARVSEAADDP